MESNGDGKRRRHSRPRIRPQGVPNWAYIAAGGCLALAFGYVAFVPLVEDRDGDALAARGDDECVGLPFLCAGGTPLGGAPEPPLGSGGFTPAPRFSPQPNPSPSELTPPPTPSAVPRTTPPTKAPAAGLRTVFASDLPFERQENGFGRVERDTSNGERDPGDGNPLTIGGVVFKKGLGVHAPSEVAFRVDGRCPRFAASIGLDDEEDNVDSSGGRVVFRVQADGTTVFQSRVMDFSDQPHAMEVSVARAQVVTLVVDTAGDDESDHADWANARLSCVRS